MTKKHVVALVLVLLMGIFVGSQCAMAASEQVEIRLMHFFTEGDARHGVMQHVLKEFAKNNPDIIVHEDAMPHDLYQTKVQTLGASGQLSDVFFMKGNWAELFSRAGGIDPLEEILDADPEFRDAFLEAGLANHLYEGKVYSLPYTIDLNALMYYNEALFEEVGLEFPTTWEELLHAIEVFKENGIIPIALGNKDQWLVPTGWLSNLVALIGGPEFMNDLCFGDAKYTDEPYIEALKALKQLVDVGAFNSDFNSIDNYQMYGLYGLGRTAIFSAGSWAASTLPESIPAEISAVTRVTVMPTYPNGKGELNTVAGGSGWGVNINSTLEGSKREAAIRLMKALSDRSFATALIEIANMPPAVSGAEYDTSSVPAIFNEIMEVQEKAIVTPVFDQVIHPELIDEMNKTTQAVMAGNMTPEVAAQRMQNIKDRLARTR